jgi:hypothetical protein
MLTMLKVEIINYSVQGISDSIIATWKFVEKLDNLLKKS